MRKHKTTSEAGTEKEGAGRVKCRGEINTHKREEGEGRGAREERGREREAERERDRETERRRETKRDGERTGKMWEG